MIATKAEKVPFVQSSWFHIETMIELSNPKPGEKIADLGSGDGRILLLFAKAGAEAHGYEIDHELILKADAKIAEQNLENKIIIYEKDFWEEDLSPYSVIAIYGMDSVMERLENKLKKELKPGSRVVSNIFQFPNWKEKETKNNVRLYVV